MLQKWKKGHFASVCHSKERPYQRRPAVCNELALAPCSSHPSSDDDMVNVLISVNGILASCLLDTSAKRNHVNLAFFRRAGLAATDNHCKEIGLAVLSSLHILNIKRRITLKYKQRKTSKASSENNLEVRRQPH